MTSALTFLQSQSLDHHISPLHIKPRPPPKIKLPEHQLFTIIAMLNKDDRRAAMLVNREWHYLIKDEKLQHLTKIISSLPNLACGKDAMHAQSKEKSESGAVIPEGSTKWDMQMSLFKQYAPVYFNVPKMFFDVARQWRVITISDLKTGRKIMGGNFSYKDFSLVQSWLFEDFLFLSTDHTLQIWYIPHQKLIMETALNESDLIRDIKMTENSLQVIFYDRNQWQLCSLMFRLPIDKPSPELFTEPKSTPAAPSMQCTML